MQKTIAGEYTNDSIVEEIIKHKPEGVKQLVKSRSTEREVGEAQEAQAELDDLKILLETQFEKPNEVVSNKIEEYLNIWAEKYNPEIINEKVLISLDQRELADIFSRTHLVWDSLSDNAQSACAELASKVVAIENVAQEIRKDKPKDNITAYSNLNAITACSILNKAGVEGADILLKQFTKKFSDHVKESVQEDGSVYDFYNRDSWHYQIFNQIAWEKTKSFLEYINTDIPKETEKNILLAREFCLDVIQNDKEHLEFVHSENKNDTTLPTYGKPFDKNSYVCKQFLAQIR